MISIDDQTFTIKMNKSSLLKTILITSAITLLLVFTDMSLKSEISFSIFYLIPITYAVFSYGRLLGIAYSIICALIWIYADIKTGMVFSSIYIPIWNTIVRFGYFIFHTIVISKLLETIKRVKDISMIDPLTKAANWRYFEEYANKSIKNAIRERQNITLAYMDVDNFKSINDLLGHSVGDEVLKELSKTIISEIRPNDLLARLGGDEFALLILNTDKDTSNQILTRIREKLNASMTNRKWDITFSIGAVIFSVIPSTIGPMIKRVDDLMYEVKKTGKNNIKIESQI